MESNWNRVTGSMWEEFQDIMQFDKSKAFSSVVFKQWCVSFTVFSYSAHSMSFIKQCNWQIHFHLLFKKKHLSIHPPKILEPSLTSALDTSYGMETKGTNSPLLLTQRSSLFWSINICWPRVNSRKCQNLG